MSDGESLPAPQTKKAMIRRPHHISACVAVAALAAISACGEDGATLENSITPEEAAERAKSDDDPDEPDTDPNGDGLISGDDTSGKLSEEQVCDEVSDDVTAAPVDMYIMLDQSISMSEPLEEGGDVSRWEGVVDAIRTFVNDPRAEGIGVGLQYFGQEAEEDCDPTKYASPAVDIAELPDVAKDIEDSLDDAAGPSTFTPTYPALEGALMHAQQHAEDNPDRATVVLLATDGVPFTEGHGDCNDAVTDIAALTEGPAAADPKVRTFVVGISAGLSNLRTIARDGQGEAFFIEQGDVQDQFVDAMLSIVNTPFACDFEIPEREGNVSFDPTTVRVTFTSTIDGKRTKEQLPELTGASDCPLVGEGWFFNNPSDPSRIHICPDTCQRFPRGKLNIEFGCRLAGTASK